ncbi:UDP-N-acetylmuramoyl-L-alanine--D-glutamate ligase [Candidatus Saccharibacteria bacterium]|nr:UDP-N-acetylmuramoyl-L-alanine--D-glutamate ligase [Candidatus Saccharibacteria bacterium]
MKIGIVGWGVEGQSAFNFFGSEHEYLIVNEEPRDDFPPQSDKIKLQFIKTERTPGLTGNVKDLSYLDGIDQCDKIIYSVTTAKNLEKIFGDKPDFWPKATTTQHIFFEEVKTKNIIGVTGSKGKGTTSTLIRDLLKAAGQTVFLGGNIGTAVLDFVREVQSDDWVVLELSNFQLYNLTYSPHIAVCLMLTDEHLEWHPNMEDYMAAKSNLFRHQKTDDIAIYFANNQYSTRVAGNSPGVKIPYFAAPGARVSGDRIVVGEADTGVITKSEIKLLGEHNLQNICAALTAVWQISQDAEVFKEVLSTFTGLEHRLEFVRELDGVKYYDDSFGTTPHTAIVALKAIVQPAVLILGGHDKGLDYKELIEEITSKKRVRHVITIGKIGPQLAQMLRERQFNNVTEGLATMPEMVAEARRVAQSGDAVLLSCGTSSFGLFKDYKDRGNQFKAAVQLLV